MSKIKISYPNGATPIDHDELKDLIPDYIATMSELNQVEQINIADAFVWGEKQDLSAVLTATFVFKLHEKMFNQVWRWAGKQRRSNKNIGVMKEQIVNDLGQLLKNTEFWIQNKTFQPDELAARFHHKLVHIHIFPNGNGRHARLMTDLLLVHINAPKFTWGKQSAATPLEVEGKTRSEYITALKKADNEDFKDLIQFVRS
jgi:Fic-DOC domain mobile mystery protein B